MRNAIIGDDLEKRKKDIPIVQVSVREEVWEEGVGHPHQRRNNIYCTNETILFCAGLPEAPRPQVRLTPPPRLYALPPQLNPGGTLNYKYQAEAAVRASGLPYSVIRSTGEQSSGGGLDLELPAKAGSPGTVPRPLLSPPLMLRPIPSHSSPAGMIDSTEGGPFLLEADQGDSISGYMGRDEVADLIVAALAMPEVRSVDFIAALIMTEI